MKQQIFIGWERGNMKPLYWILVILCTCILTSCNGAPHNNSESVDTSNSMFYDGSDADDASSGWVDVQIFSDTLIYRTYFSESEEKIAVEKSTDGGQSWRKNFVSYKEYGYGINEVYISFINELEGYLLYCGSPGAGLMNEVIFKTIDGGKTFSEIADISTQISNYPNGMEFLTSEIGYITVTYHGHNVFFYQTNDGGKTWFEQSIALPSMDYSYAQGKDLSRNEQNEIEMVVELVAVEETKTVTYYTDDGISWNLC